MLTCPMPLLKQPPIKVESHKLSSSVANQLCKQLQLLTPGNAGLLVPAESCSCLLPKGGGHNAGKRGAIGHGLSMKWLSHHSSAGALAFFTFHFFTFS